jgi:ectoine hydroxylase-related dioxygenase (phytanoyl-CoA dioxygenase family)
MQHFCTLNMQKDTGTGGWEYHQDYGYHYNEFFYPDFVSVMVALDPATRDNGCLRVVRGSHRLGRLEHESFGSQRIANRERVAMALEEFEEVHCEMAAGSVLYFHGNTLHASNANLSDTSRWCLIFDYVPATNRWMLPRKPQLAPIAGLDDATFRAAMTSHEDRILQGP